ncbi:glycosyltransferase family 61 protein [Methylobacterium sp. Leaf85]|uniref:glycosyltransferase family 61 protein n=1 Tax=Methylobacterium sp. Leaf85 TaxID=1736241 RepID=UPI000AD5CB9E|nr:glycosyltransferase 61 family protein [Methylobacterium sp. Leaf85]
MTAHGTDNKISSEDKRLLKKCRADMERLRWEDIIEKTSNKNFNDSNCQILMIRLHAAIELKALDIIEDTVRVAINSDIRNNVKFAIVRILANKHHGDAAALILTSDVKLPGDVLFLRLIIRYLPFVTDKLLRHKVRVLINKVSLGGYKIKPNPSEFHFASQPQSNVWGSLVIASSSEADKHHTRGIRKEIALLRRLVEKPDQPQISQLKNVFIDSYGQIWNERGQIITTCGMPIGTIDKKDVTLVKTAFASTRITRGIYHWIIDRLPGLAWIEKSGVLNDDGFAILLSGDRKFERESLELLDLQHAAMHLDRPIFVEKLLLSRPEFPNMAGWTHLDDVFEKLGRRADEIARKNKAALPDKVYVTRRDATRRRLINESEIEKEANEFGFIVQELSSIPLWHQIAIARHAHTIMGPHGAGLSHSVFAKPGSKIVELLPIRDGTYQPRLNFIRLSHIKGHQHVVWYENQKIGIDPWSINLDEWKQFMKKQNIFR